MGKCAKCGKDKPVEGDLLSDCCGSDFDPLGFRREDGLWQEKCLKCGKECEPIWRKVPKSEPVEEGWEKRFLKFWNASGTRRRHPDSTIKFIKSLLLEQEDRIVGIIKNNYKNTDRYGNDARYILDKLIKDIKK